MGWDYEYRIAYGIQVKSRGDIELKSLLKEYSKVLQYDAAMSTLGYGSIFIYFRSTYKILDRDHGTYSLRSPDAEGTEFHNPLHPCDTKINIDKPIPPLTVEEINAMSKITEHLGYMTESIWIENGCIFY